MLTKDEISDLYEQRSRLLSPTLGGMARVKEVYEGDLVVNLPEVDGFHKPPVPNLLAQGVDQMGGRIASVTPEITVLPQKANRTQERRAVTAARVLGGWWATDRLPLKLHTRARHLVAYGATTAVLTWNAREHRPVWTVRSPLNALPAPDPHHSHPRPRDIIYAYTTTVGQMRADGYGQQASIVAGYDAEDGERMTLLEYLDPEQHALTLIGTDRFGNRTAVFCENWMHGLGETPATYITRTGLETLSGQFDQMIGMYEAQATLMALEILAVQKGIFPDTYLESRPGEIAQFVDGPHDGRTGLVSIVAGGTIREINPQPGYLTNPTIDRLERNQRVSGGIPPEFGGESGTNLRTGRRGDAVLSATIDMPIAYAQQLLADGLECENTTATAMALAYDRNGTRTLVKGLGNADKPVTYSPGIVFADSPQSQVAYPAAGSDINTLIVGLGQRVGLGIMSKRTAAKLDPYVDSPEFEHDRVVSEGLETALLTGLQQQASSGGIPPAALARIMRLVETDRKELAEALDQVMREAQEEAQAEQAQAAPDAGPTAAALSGNPEAASPIPGVGPGPSDLTAMLASLRMPLAGMENRVGQPTATGNVRV